MELLAIHKHIWLRLWQILVILCVVALAIWLAGKPSMEETCRYLNLYKTPEDVYPACAPYLLTEEEMNIVNQKRINTVK